MYNYRKIDTTTEAAQKYKDSFLRYITPEMKKIDDNSFSDWKVRYYIAGKYTMSTTVFVNSLRYAYSNNLVFVLPYLAYYGLFTAGRVLLTINPKNNWKDGELIKSNHSKIIALVCDEINRFDKSEAIVFKDSFSRLKSFREAFSYNFAMGGVYTFDIDKWFDIDILLGQITYILELAQLQSEIFSDQYQKQHPNHHNFLEHKIDELYEYQLADEVLMDSNDAFFTFKMFRKQESIYPLSYQMSSGTLEDYFAGISIKEKIAKYHFDPDKDLNIVFDLDY